MYSTTSDILNFMDRVLQMKHDDVLSTRGYVQLLYPGGPLYDGVSSYGKSGWEVAFANGLRTVTKEGICGGFGSYITLVPDLKLGMFVWANAQITISALAANVTNMIVPKILTTLETMQQKPECPAIDDIVGTYVSGDTTQFVIQKSDDAAIPNMLFGQIGGSPYWFEYDQKTTEAVGAPDTYYFRYFLIADDPDYSCINLGMGGVDNGLIRFQKVQGNWEAIRYDTWTSASKKQ